MIRVAINGFGRIGRVALRVLHERLKTNTTNIELVAINDLSCPEDLAHLLKYDSVHGRFNADVLASKDSLKVDDKTIKIFKAKDPSELPWKDLGIDVVLESTGHFLTRELASKHLTAGARKVLISTPAKTDKDADATICYGVNHDVYEDSMSIISTASCTTNCIAPIAKIINDEFCIKKSLVTTIHSYTRDQNLVDSSHCDKRRSRAAALSMIPTSTGAAKAMALVLPELKGKFEGLAIRVPTPNVSLVDMVCVLEKQVSASYVNEVLETASLGKFKGILGFCKEPLVSIDMNGTSCSSIIDSLCTMVVDKDTVKILSWYDNEYGFTNRAIDLMELIGK